jgi:hypothetical protein
LYQQYGLLAGQLSCHAAHTAAGSALAVAAAIASAAASGIAAVTAAGCISPARFHNPAHEVAVVTGINR